MLILTENADPLLARYVVKIVESFKEIHRLPLSESEARELWVLLSFQFDPPKRAKRKGAKK